MDLEKLKYPIGKFIPQENYNDETVNRFIDCLEKFPHDLEAIVKNLDNDQLRRTYRPGGWTIKQVIHHVADSHSNALIRIKMALTENNPIIKPYDEAAFAELPDYEMDISFSFEMIKCVHKKMVYLLEYTLPKDLDKTYFHPQHQQKFTLKMGLANYEWHCLHHLAHINQALKLNI